MSESKTNDLDYVGEAGLFLIRWAFIITTLLLLFVFGLQTVNAASEVAPALYSSFNLSNTPSTTPSDYYVWDNFSDGTVNSTLWTNANSAASESGGVLTLTGTNRLTTYLFSKQPNLKNYTVEFQAVLTGGTYYYPIFDATETKNEQAATEPGSEILWQVDYGGTTKTGWVTDYDGDGANSDIINQSYVYDGATYSNITVYVNSTGGFFFWINGKLYGNYAGFGVSTNKYVKFAVQSGSGLIKNFRIFNGTATPGYVPPSPPIPPTIINNTAPNITIIYPTINETTLDNFTYPIAINGTVTVQNGSIQNITINNTNFKNYGNQTNFSFRVNGSVSQQRYDVLLNATSEYGNYTTTILSFTIDFNAPSVTGSTFDLNRSVFYIGRNITFQFNYSDNIKIFHINVTTETYSVELTNINQSTFIYNGSINGSTFGLGRHQINTTYCDAHTKNEIGIWDNNKDYNKKELRFEFSKGDFSVRPKDASLIDSFDTEKKKDRYIFKYSKKANKKSDIQTFIVSSTAKIDIIGNDNGYYGWLIIKDLNKWIDFNLADGTLPIYKITRIDAYNVEVEMNGITSDTFEFHSAGDLNCNSRSYYYYLFNYTAIYNSAVTESVIENIKLVVDTGGIFFKGNGTLNYNGIDYNTTNTTSNNQLNFSIDLNIPQPPLNVSNFTFYWNFDLNSTLFTTTNFSQTASRVRLLVCSLNEEMRVLNISIFDENNPTNYLEADINAVFTSWTNDSGNTLNFTFVLKGDTNYSICLAPNTSITTNTYFQYNTSGGFAQRWFLTNARLNQNTSLLYLYDFSSTSGISTLKGTLKDNTYAFFPLVVTKLQRFYTAENVWRTIQMDRSDDFGLVLFNIIETSTDYRIIFEQNGAELSRTNPSKFKCTSGLCDLTYIVNVIGSNSVASPKFRTGFDNRTRIYQLNFTDTTGLTSSARLKVTKETRGQIITICDQTLTASDGTINCNLTGYDGNIIARVYSSASPETAKLTEYISIVVGALFQRANTYITNNELTFWGAAISVTLTVAGAIFNPIAGIIMYIVSLIGIYAFGIINFVTVTFITLMACLAVVVSILINMGKNG